MNTKLTGERIKIMRTDCNMTQSDLAEALDGFKKEGDTGKSKISKYEHGAVPPLDVIITLSEIFNSHSSAGCTPEYLLGIDKYKTRTVSELAEQIPLNDTSIDLLTKIKKECDECGDSDPIEHDCHLKKLLVDEVVRYIITPPDRVDFQHLTPTEFLELSKDYLHYESIVYEEKGLAEECHSEEYRKAKRQMRAIENEIGLYIGKCIGYRLQSYYAESYGEEANT